MKTTMQKQLLVNAAKNMQEWYPGVKPDEILGEYLLRKLLKGMLEDEATRRAAPMNESRLVEVQQFDSPTDFSLFLGTCDDCDLHFDTESGCLLVCDGREVLSSCCKTDRFAKALRLAIESKLAAPAHGERE